MKVYLAGDLMIDDYHYCTAKGISPEAPIIHFKREYTFRQLGGAGNVALNLVALQNLWATNKEFEFLGPVQADIDADLVNKPCFEDSFRDDQPVCVKNRLVSGDVTQQIVRYDDDSLYLKDGDTSFCRHIRAAEKAKVGVASDYLHGSITNGVLRALRSICEVVLVDPKGADWKKYKRTTDVITPNLAEVHSLVPGEYSHDDAAKHLLDLTRAFAVVLKKGRQKQVIDVTGAGDTFISTLAMCMARGFGFLAAVEAANAMAGLSVTRQGCFVPNKVDIQEILVCREKKLQKD
jgi:D-beta-D-heptose 7-phosphate kinase/D-beta-D-heptose 1-phosphate adenosyltransferase